MNDNKLSIKEKINCLLDCYGDIVISKSNDDCRAYIVKATYVFYDEETKEPRRRNVFIGSGSSVEEAIAVSTVNKFWKVKGYEDLHVADQKILESVYDIISPLCGNNLNVQITGTFVSFELEEKYKDAPKTYRTFADVKEMYAKTFFRDGKIGFMRLKQDGTYSSPGGF